MGQFLKSNTENENLRRHSLKGECLDLIVKLCKESRVIACPQLQNFVTETQGGSNLFLSSQTDKLMAGTKFSGYLGLNHYKKAKK